MHAAACPFEPLRHQKIDGDLRPRGRSPCLITPGRHILAHLIVNPRCLRQTRTPFLNFQGTFKSLQTSVRLTSWFHIYLYLSCHNCHGLPMPNIPWKLWPLPCFPAFFDISSRAVPFPSNVLTWFPDHPCRLGFLGQHVRSTTMFSPSHPNPYIGESLLTLFLDSLQ